MENEAQLINKYQAEFENACDDLYYGYGYKFWRTNNNSIEDDNIAKMVWKAAFNKMSSSESKTKNMKKSTVKLNETQLKNIVTESVKRVIKEYGYYSNPQNEYEYFSEIGESAAYHAMRELKEYEMYYGDINEEAFERVLNGFKRSFIALCDVGDEVIGIKGYGVKLS